MNLAVSTPEALPAGVPRESRASHPAIRYSLIQAKRFAVGAAMVAILAVGCRPGSSPANPAEVSPRSEPFVIVLGVAQDGGIPQTGSHPHPGWTDPSLARRVVSLGLVDPRSGKRWLFEATPDFPEQLATLHELTGGAGPPDGVFLTHAHMGHYTGLMFLGHESMGARGVPVFAMPRMGRYLSENGPWDQLVRYGNIELRELAAGRALELAPGLEVTPIPVPHRQEYSEVVAFRIDGPERSVLFLPDIDSWEEWDAEGTRIEQVLEQVDVAYLDGTFFADGEIPGRDMSGFPHPFIAHTMERLRGLPPAERAKVRFLHLNHTNPAWRPDSAERKSIAAAGFRVAEEGEIVELGLGG